MLIGFKNYYIVGMPTTAQTVDDWCEKNIGPYDTGWYWVHPHGDNVVLRIINEDDAILFKLTFEL